MKRSIPCLMMILFLVWSMTVSAQTGSVEIIRETDQEMTVFYTKAASKIGDCYVLEEQYKSSNINFNRELTAEEMQKAAKKLSQMTRTGKEVTAKDTVKISDLEEGVYLIQVYGGAEINPMLIYIPTYLNEEQDAIYEIQVYPKYRTETSAPDTGWKSGEVYYLVLLVISFTIIVRLSCHKRFKCGRIPFKYS